MEAISDREIMIRLHDNVTTLKEAIERFAKTLENLETIKIKDHEQRLSKVERFVSEWAGAYKIIAIVGLVLGIVSLIMGIKHSVF